MHFLKKTRRRPNYVFSSDRSNGESKRMADKRKHRCRPPLLKQSIVCQLRHSHSQTKRQADRQTDRQIEYTWRKKGKGTGLTERYTDIQIDRQAGRQTDRQSVRQTNQRHMCASYRRYITHTGHASLKLKLELNLQLRGKRNRKLPFDRSFWLEMQHISIWSVTQAAKVCFGICGLGGRQAKCLLKWN